MMNRILIGAGALLAVWGASSPAEAYWEHTQVDRVVIASDAQSVFTYATTAENWVDWHPNTQGTDGDDDHSATVGEEIVEFVTDPIGAPNTIFWTVTEYEEGRYWQIAGYSEDGVWDFEITYEFIPLWAGRSLWRRTLVYGTDAPIPRLLLGALVFYMDVVSRRAVRNFKREMEALPAP